MNYAKNYDPYKHLKQSLKEDGLPAYEPYLDPTGNVSYDNTGRIIMVPIVHLDANAYRDWFTKEFPSGRVDVIRHTPDPYLVENALVYPTEVFEVRLYTSSEVDTYKANGWGKSAYLENAEFDEIGTAITHAFKNAMRNMGFGVDLDREVIQHNLPKFVEATQPGRIGEVEPAKQQEAKPDPAMLQPESVRQSQQENPVPAQQTANIKANMPDAAPDTAGEYSELLTYFASKEKSVAEATAEVNTTSDDPQALEKPETTTSDSDKSNEHDKIVFRVLDPKNDPLGKFDGMSLDVMYKKNRNILLMIQKPTFRWQGRLDEEMYTAIQNLK